MSAERPATTTPSPQERCAACGVELDAESAYHTHRLGRAACGACLRVLNDEEIDDAEDAPLSPRDERKRRLAFIVAGAVIVALGLLVIVGGLTVTDNFGDRRIYLAPLLLIAYGLSMIVQGGKPAARGGTEPGPVGHPFRTSGGSPPPSRDGDEVRRVVDALVKGAVPDADCVSIRLQRESADEPAMNQKLTGFAGSAAQAEAVAELALDVGDALDRASGPRWRTLIFEARKDPSTGSWSRDLRIDPLVAEDDPSAPGR